MENESKQLTLAYADRSLRREQFWGLVALLFTVTGLLGLGICHLMLPSGRPHRFEILWFPPMLCIAAGFYGGIFALYRDKHRTLANINMMIVAMAVIAGAVSDAIGFYSFS
jgi:hypothetical protein